MDYPYENLGPERFQQFCQALFAKEHSKFQSFPIAQPDGGRDAIWYYNSAEEPAFGVFQVKFVRNPFADVNPHKWLVEIVAEEAPKVKKLIPRGARNYFLLTNVSGTAHPESGSIDKMNELLSSETGLPSVCYWRDDLNRKLDGNWDLKWVYPELMTGPDLIRALIESGLSEYQQRRSDAIRGFLRGQYEIDKQVRFKQVELQNNLLDLFIDVPISQEHLSTREQHQLIASISRSTAIQEESDDNAQDDYVMSYEARIHRRYQANGPPVGAATMLLHPVTQARMKRIVLEGAPGQGKSTLAQYVCQVHRMRILGRSEDLNAVSSYHKSGPIRVPFKVDLRDLSTWLNKKDPFSPEESEVPPQHWFKSLESFLAAQVRHHSGGAEFSQDDLISVARVSAILVVFDGLDEVADIKRRQEVVDEIVKGVNRLEECAASLQVLVTSRPAVFVNSPGLPEDRFPYFQLGSVTRSLIEDYANKWLRARRVDSRQSGEFKRILKEKLDQPHLRDLARNPMQLAILLSLIHTRGSSLPDKRTALYDSYVELFFNRESEKSDIVREHRDLLIDIHRYLAWILHSEAEQGHDRGSVSSERLLTLVSKYLSREGHDPKLATQLFAGMVERVVALVSRVVGTYEFEVQPLREYFAARFLYDTAPYSPPGNERRGTKPDRFDAIARDFYWLNVTRFYAGCYSKGELPSLVDRIHELTKDAGYRYTSHPRILASTLLADWVFSQHPKSVRDVVGLMLDGLGLRFVLTSTRRRLASATPVVLPPKCGRDELVQHCFNILRSNPPRDYAVDVIDLIKANSTPQDIEEYWFAQLSSAKGEVRLRWLDYGLRLELLPRIAPDKLSQVLPEQDFGDEVLSLLFRARRFDLIEGKRDQWNALVGLVLRGKLATTPQRADSILDLVIHALDARRYSEAFRFRQPIPLADLWQRGDNVRFASLNRDHLSQAATSDEVEKCFDVIDAAKAASQRPASEWACDLGPWTDVVECARDRWGDNWAIYHMATVASGIRSSTETYKTYPDLLDHSKPLCARTRYARLRAGSPAWWGRQVEKAKTELDLMFLSLVLLRWGSAATLSGMSERMGTVLQHLTVGGWTQLSTALRQSLSWSYEPREGAFLSFAAFRLPPKLSPRWAAALGLRTKPTDRHQMYKMYLADYVDNDRVVLEFCQRVGVDLSRIDAGEWQANLELVRRSYAQGVISEPFAFQRVLRRGIDPQALPLSVAEEIAANADKYPGYLVGLAEAKCRSAVASNIIPVGKVAARDAWFEFDSPDD